MYQAGEEKRFDQKNIGLTLFNQSEYKKMLSKAQKGDRDIYFTQREGQSNKGHYFKSFDSFTNADRYALI